MNSVCRRVCKVSVEGLLLELGFQFCENMALETLTEIMQSLLRQIGTSSHMYCEHAGRVQPVIGDVVMALVDMGIVPDHIEAYAKRNERVILPPLLKASHPKRVNNLHVGKVQPHPAHIPEYLPPLPDLHTFMRIPTHRKPAIEYEELREKSSTHQQCVEKALTRFVAKTSDTQSYFSNADKNLFPLIPCQSQNPAYLKALLTCDQMCQFQDEFCVPQPNRKSQSPNKRPFKYMIVQENNEHEMQGPDGEPIDNPYLRPMKIKLVQVPVPVRKKRQRKC